MKPSRLEHQDLKLPFFVPTCVLTSKLRRSRSSQNPVIKTVCGRRLWKSVHPTWIHNAGFALGSDTGEQQPECTRGHGNKAAAPLSGHGETSGGKPFLSATEALNAPLFPLRSVAFRPC